VIVIAVVSLRDLKFRNVYFRGIFMKKTFQKKLNPCIQKQSSIRTRIVFLGD